MFHGKDANLVKGITLNVKDLEKMTVFYDSILGLNIKSKDDKQTVFEIGNSGHNIILNLLVDGREPSMREAGLFHLAILLPTTADLADFLLHASRLNVRLGAGDHIVSEALYLNDPEGNGLEIYRDRNPETWVWNDGNVNMDTLEVDAEALVQHVSTEGWNGMPEGAKIGHLHLKTSNINESKDFYTDTLGLKIVVGNFPNALFMSTKDYHHHIAINTWQSNKKREDLDHSYGLANIDMQIPNRAPEVLISPDGLRFDINPE
ncbi:VOC family protein [Mammaliicoccus sciuri]|jgi:catechol 2,3-dioxygenase|uniref:VOC family protein n=1 Tax=Mammaliicoccus sciuri TaxID=1296 RepID=UPI001FB3304F|nr:VOC family protein [Mammaliicoccus sciuri]MCJ0935085.1 VOC family protein [Mammaliicoccus sciuri]MDT0709476.1 VOC family protein [Mammaliicoccus sciuri]